MCYDRSPGLPSVTEISARVGLEDVEKWAARTWCCHSNRHGEGVGEQVPGGNVGRAQGRDTVGRKGRGEVFKVSRCRYVDGGFSKGGFWNVDGGGGGGGGGAYKVSRSQDVNGNVDRVEFGCGLERLFLSLTFLNYSNYGVVMYTCYLVYS
jgi:hypothetical protein